MSEEGYEQKYVKEPFDTNLLVPMGPNMLAYTNGVEDDLFKVGFCLPAGPYVTDDDVRYIVDCIKEAVA